MKISIYAEGVQNTEKALRQLKKIISDEWIVDTINDPSILTLPQHKVIKPEPVINGEKNEFSIFTTKLYSAGFTNRLIVAMLTGTHIILKF